MNQPKDSEQIDATELAVEPDSEPSLRGSAAEIFIIPGDPADIIVQAPDPVSHYIGDRPVVGGLLVPDLRPDQERMAIRSQTPELDHIFVPAIDFPGTVVKAGHCHERSFGFGRECRVVGVKHPKGLVIERVVVRIGPRFRPVKEDGQEVARYEGEDARVYEGADVVRQGEWKKHRLVPEVSAIYLLARNTTGDDLKFEGTILLQEDRVPTPEHEEI